MAPAACWHTEQELVLPTVTEVNFGTPAQAALIGCAVLCSWHKEAHLQTNSLDSKDWMAEHQTTIVKGDIIK